MDQRSQHLPKVMLWGMAMFLTNVFLMPYMALRLKHSPSASAHLPQKGILARVFGVLGLSVGTLAVAWFCFNQPDVGGVLSRWAYLGQQISTNRVTLAFMVDITLFWIFQIWLMGAVIPMGERLRPCRFVPFWGLALWLVIWR